MASIEKRGKDSYRLIVEVGYDAKGKRVKRTKTVKAKGIREAEKELVKFQTEVEVGEYIAPEKMSFDTFLAVWREKYGQKHLEVKTLETYDIMLKNHILPSFGTCRISDLKPIHIMVLLDELSREGSRKDGKSGGLASSSIRFVHRILKDIFERAVEWRIIKLNPVSAVKRPKIQDHEVDVYGEQEVELLFQALEKEPIHWRIMITLALTTGLRRGELLGLEWKHLDLQLGTIEVIQSLSHSRGVNILKEPKTKNSKRKIAIPDSLLEDLRAYYVHAVQLRKMLGDCWQGGVEFHVFFSETGKPFYHTAPGTWFRRFIHRVGLKRIRFHDLRHTSATLLINQGVHAKIISSRLGHADIRTTMNIYGHALRTADHAAANTFNRLLDVREI
ncbi:tyrosine-type recombinase/integrase [Cohnella panacarvi]|uniref:tyrosine-type recombinase/integrase n=1 Tax=Cohnella panacarvi TaxID=400776 RepID=UPI00047C61FC|nr:site-specific integrase [Cohnella panacarvi]